ncbi:hypothetical protein ABH926_003398 [Catenulispora sp. GP43]|uniref:hypothetical protein n=1 Tax=Catenulispora sp. GP43 TaxID=3156263 RepID=UPI003515033D
MRDENFEIGDEVFCEAKACGRLSAVTVVPAKARLAHLIVDSYPQGEPRLIPARQAHATADGLALDCSQDQFDSAEAATVTYVEPAEAADSVDDEMHRRHHDGISTWPAEGPGPGMPTPSVGAPAPFPGPTPQVETETRVPPGEVRVHEGTGVHVIDGELGLVAGVMVRPRDKRLEYILVDAGHLWWRRRVAIPMALVRGMDDAGITVRLSKRQIRDLRPVGHRRG